MVNSKGIKEMFKMAIKAPLLHYSLKELYNSDDPTLYKEVGFVLGTVLYPTAGVLASFSLIPNVYFASAVSLMVSFLPASVSKIYSLIRDSNEKPEDSIEDSVEDLPPKDRVASLLEWENREIEMITRLYGNTPDAQKMKLRASEDTQRMMGYLFESGKI